MTGDAPGGPGRELPHWSSVLAVVAHPDDESFGLGAVIDRMSGSGTAVQVLCFTHGEVSTLNETGALLHEARERELCLASAELGAAAVRLLDYGDGRLASAPRGELTAHVLAAARQYDVDGLLVFDETGVTGHRDHQAATAAAVDAGCRAGLPVLAWALPEEVARTLREETGQPFAGRAPGGLDLRIRVSRCAQCRAVRAHASQIPPGAVVWRRLELLGDHEHLRWLV